MKKTIALLMVLLLLCGALASCGLKKPSETPTDPPTDAPSTDAPSDKKTTLLPQMPKDLPIYVPGSMKLMPYVWEDFRFDRPYRIIWYQIPGPFYDLLESEQKIVDEWQWFYEDGIRTENGKTQTEMSLVTFIKRNNITREQFDRALAVIMEKTNEEDVYGDRHEFFEWPNADIIYTLDNEIINRYYRYESDVSPNEQVYDNDFKPSKEYFVPQDEDEYDFVRKYRLVYYEIDDCFWALIKDENKRKKEQKYFAELKKKNKGGELQEEMSLVTFVKRNNISQMDFERASIACNQKIDKERPNEISERTESARTDLIYTFNNEEINRYYRYE